jgi:(1->4)-alpha-D-glucan 1-alpha-D-glucosylmutase
MLLQTLLGSWPLDLDLHDDNALRQYAERIRQWQQKALREAKLRSSWSAPNEAYEAPVPATSTACCWTARTSNCASPLADAAQLLACPGALNGLVQTLLRMTVPGVPDLYQGNEYWDFSLVDPDNRRPWTTLRGVAPWTTPRRRRAAGALARRPHQAGLDRAGAGLPPGPRRAVPPRRLPALSVQGRHADKVLAFARLGEGERAIVVAPRLASGLLGGAYTVDPGTELGRHPVVLPFAVACQLDGTFPCAAVSSSRS